MALWTDLSDWGHILPCEGGYLDQPWTLMQDLRIVRLAIQHRQAALALQAEKQPEIDDLARQAQGMAGAYVPTQTE